nr:hypothetical protein [Tanacetum cinerariifolium]
HVNTARPKAVINRRNRVKDVQASTSWVWKSVKPNSASIILKRYDYVDVRGRSRNLIADAASSLGEDCWELNVRSIPTSSVVFPLPVMCSHCQKKFPLLEESFHCQKKFPLVASDDLRDALSVLYLTSAHLRQVNGLQSSKTSLRAESVSQGAKTRHKKLAKSFKQTSVFSKEATKCGSSKAPTSSKTGHSKRRKESSSTIDSNPNRPSVSTLVDTEMYKENQQVTGGLTSLGVTSEERANPQLSRESSIAMHGDKKEAFTIIKLEDLAKLVSQIQPSFKDLDLPKDDHIIIVDESDEDEPNVETEDTSVPRSLSPSSLPTELKDLPSKFNELTEEIKGLKTQVHELEIQLPKELKENPTKLEDFTKTASSLTSQVTELKTLQWELPEEFISLSANVESAQAKLKTLDSLSSLLLNVTKTLNKFAEVLESTSTKDGDQSVSSARQANTMPAEAQKDTNQATIS